MRLVHNWKTVMVRAWSVRLIALAALLSGVEAALQLAGNVLGWPSGLFALASALATAAAFIARLFAQSSLSGEP